jgi:hypothetical protein
MGLQNFTQVKKMKNISIKKLAFLAIIFLYSLLSLADDASKGLEIAILADKNTEGFIDSQSSMEMQLTNRKGNVVTREMKSKRLEVAGDGDKSLIVFESPRDVKGVAILSFSHKNSSDDQWLYLPALKRIKRIASKNKSGPFLGSEYTFEDLSSQEVEKFSYRFLRDEDLNGQPNHIIERIPLDPYSGYTKQIVWIDTQNYLIQKVEYYDRKSFHLKTGTFSGYKKYLDKIWQASRMEIINHQNKKKTVLIFKDIAFKTGLSDKDFSQNSLKRSR